jgi:hypothetical protein
MADAAHERIAGRPAVRYFFILVTPANAAKDKFFWVGPKK